MYDHYPYEDDRRHCVHISKRPHIEGNYGGLVPIGPTLASAGKFKLTFSEALALASKYSGVSGVGRLLLPGDQRATVDLDGAFDENGELTDLASATVQLINAHWETSPSGNGLHGYTSEEAPPDWRNFSGLEVYPTYGPRFMTVTGNAYSVKRFTDKPLAKALEILEDFRPEPAEYADLTEGRWRRIADNVPTPEGEGHFTERSWYLHSAAVGTPIEVAVNVLLRYEQDGSFLGRDRPRTSREVWRQARDAYRSAMEWVEGGR